METGTEATGGDVTPPTGGDVTPPTSVIVTVTPADSHSPLLPDPTTTASAPTGSPEDKGGVGVASPEDKGGVDVASPEDKDEGNTSIERVSTISSKEGTEMDHPLPALSPPGNISREDPGPKINGLTEVMLTFLLYRTTACEHALTFLSTG